MFNRYIKYFLLLILFLSTGAAFPQPKTVRIGYISDGPYYYYQECWGRFKKEMEVLAGSDFQVLYPAEAQLIDDWVPEEIVSNCRKLLADPGVDIIVVDTVLSRDRLSVGRNKGKTS